MFRLKSCRAADSDVNEYASTQRSRRRQSGRFRVRVEQKAEEHRENSWRVQQKAETGPTQEQERNGRASSGSDRKKASIR